MKVVIEEDGRTRINADDGRAIHRKGEPCGQIVSVLLRAGDEPANWEDCDITSVEVEPMKYSTLSIKRELDRLGRWDATKALLTASGFWDDYVLANYLDEQDEVFKTACTALVEKGIVTSEELKELLPRCVWTAD